jgi:spore coat polysaccharide biosynthesis predicted glycosyltransferase SpsG/CMP-N-acetylneuraminic acid synthetase
VVVLTEDDEVALLAEREGCAARVDPRAGTPSESELEALLHEAIAAEESVRGARFETVVLLRPAAPLVTAGDVQDAIAQLGVGSDDSVISAREETEHAWMRVDGRFVPDFGRRSQDPSGPLYREIGAFIVSRRSAIEPGHFVGSKVGMALVPAARAVHITSPHEWWICERLLERKRIVFVVAGYPEVGMGHIYRAQQIAHEINNHEVRFVCTRESELAERAIAAAGYTVTRQGEEPLDEAVLRHEPDLVINDFLDTTAEYVRLLQAGGARVVNFEDLGSGAAAADLVINELYLEPSIETNHRVGPAYFCIREEFLQARPKPFSPRAEEVLVTFGGADSEDLTSRTLRVIAPEARRRGLRISVVTGMGYAHAATLDAQIASFGTPLVERANGTKRMSEFMERADLAFASSGRTLFELATLRVPAIVMACNARETTHPFARAHGGFEYLGRHDEVTDAALREAFVRTVDQPALRQQMRASLAAFDFRQGKSRVLAELSSVLGSPLR